MKLSVYEITGENAMTRQAGEALYSKVHPLLREGQSVELDFAGVKRHLTVFFNFAIGQLYRDISAENLQRLMTVSNLTPLGQKVLERVRENAERYYSDERYRKAVDNLIEEQSVCL